MNPRLSAGRMEGLLHILKSFAVGEDIRAVNSPGESLKGAPRNVWLIGISLRSPFLVTSKLDFVPF
jgi:hypothetical protein